MQAIKIDPQFNELQKPETILNHIQELKKADVAEKKVKQNPFPVEVFPKEVQEIITATNESLNFPIDFIGASILYAVSVSIGNTHRVEVKNGWRENAVLYLAFVGRSGTNKSHPISFAIKPIEKEDGSNYQKYQREKQEYDTILARTKGGEQQADNELSKPTWEQHLVSDFTPEALAEVHKFNKRGIGVYVDELASWFKNFNRCAHGLGGHENFGDKHVAILHFFADNIHTFDQSAVKNFLGVHAFIKGTFNKTLKFFGISGYQCI